MSVNRMVLRSAIVRTGGSRSRAMSKRRNCSPNRGQCAAATTAMTRAKNRTYSPARVSLRRVGRRMSALVVDGEVGVVDLLVGAVVADVGQRGVDRVHQRSEERRVGKEWR